MEPIRRLRRLFVFDTWANREALESLRGVAAEPARPAVRVLAHIAATKHLWLARILGEPAPMPVWPEMDLDAAAGALASADLRWGGYLARLDEPELTRPIAYVNSRGESWTNPVEAILDHLVLHNHYHRGQIAARVRAAGGTPAQTDFIHAVRTHALPPEEVVRD